MYNTMLERFIKYVKFETRSDEKSESVPSTKTQIAFLEMLKKDLEEIGLEDVYINKGYFLNATLKSNIDKKVPTIGFIAHVDTADFNAIGVNPQIHKNYDGCDVKLNDNCIMTVKNFKNLKNYKGKTLITTDGTTLLGADDKAGVTEIVEAMKFLIENKDIKHGDIKIAFGPDEEIGRGAKLFDVKEFSADFAYTMDAGPIGELEYESFNAAQIEYTINGVSVHPGTAKDQMINANLLGVELASMFPQKEVPEHTEKYEGFYLLHNFSGRIEKTELTYIIRDHDKEKFNKRKEFCVEIANKMNEKYGKATVEYNLFDQYYNMGDIISKDMTSVNLAKLAMENLNIKPLIHPIRGGTDGSIISYMGLPTPNIFVGGENFHGQYEICALEDMMAAANVIVEIVKLNAK